MNIRRLLMALVAILVMLPIGLAEAQGGPPPLIPNLNDGISEDSIVVDIQFLESCGGEDSPEEPCWLTVHQSGPGVSDRAFGTAIDSTSWYQCGIRVYNYLGTHVATLTNNTQAELRPQSPRWRLVSGYNSTWAGTGYSWDNLYGPASYDNWGQWVYSTWTYSHGRLRYLGVIFNWYNARNYFYSNGTWSCQGGSGQVNPHP